MINNVYQCINHIFIEGDNNKEMWAEAKELEQDYEIIEIIFRWGAEKPRLKIYAPKNEIQKTINNLKQKYGITNKKQNDYTRRI